MGEQPDLYETDEDSDGPEMKKKRGPVKKKPKTVYLTLPMARAAHAQTKAAAGSGASSAAQASGPPSGVKSRVSGAASNSAPSLGAAAGPSDARTPGTGQKKRKRPEASSAAKPSREERGKASAGQKRGSGKKSAPQPAADPAKPEKPVQMTGKARVDNHCITHGHFISTYVTRSAIRTTSHLNCKVHLTHTIMSQSDCITLVSLSRVYVPQVFYPWSSLLTLRWVTSSAFRGSALESESLQSLAVMTCNPHTNVCSDVASPSSVRSLAFHHCTHVSSKEQLPVECG